METTDYGTESFGERIARLRRAKGWNQRELARRTGLKATQISKYERGAWPRADGLPPLSRALGVSTDYLLTGRSYGETRRDLRLRDRLEILEALPEVQRNNLIGFLDSLLSAHNSLNELLEQVAERRKQGGAGRKQETDPKRTRRGSGPKGRGKPKS